MGIIQPIFIVFCIYILLASQTGEVHSFLITKSDTGNGN